MRCHIQHTQRTHMYVDTCKLYTTSTTITITIYLHQFRSSFANERLKSFLRYSLVCSISWCIVAQSKTSCYRVRIEVRSACKFRRFVQKRFPYRSLAANNDHFSSANGQLKYVTVVFGQRSDGLVHLSSKKRNVSNYRKAPWTRKLFATRLRWKHRSPQ